MNATRSGFVALLGAPNAGKSTLLNALVGTKLSIVTPKAQTTRARITGIAIEGKTQIVFIDTPGIFCTPRRSLEKSMIAVAWAAVGDADAIAVLVDAKEGIRPALKSIIAGLVDRQRQAVLILNKIDLAKKPDLLDLAAKLNATGVFTDTFMISAQTGDGVKDVAKHFERTLPQGAWLFPEDQITDAPLRFLAAEITREQAFLKLHHELPYALAVETVQWRELQDGSLRVEQVLHCARDAHKGIIIGKNGAMLKTIGSAARQEIASLTGKSVHLFLHVRVDRHWPPRSLFSHGHRQQFVS